MAAALYHVLQPLRGNGLFRGAPCEGSTAKVGQPVCLATTLYRRFSMGEGREGKSNPDDLGANL